MTLLVTSAPNQPLVRDGSLQDAAKFTELVASLPLTDTPSNWAVTFDGIQAALSTALYSDKEVVLITDMRRSGWSKDVTRAANDLAAERVPLRIIDVGDRRTDNIALLKFGLEDALPLPNQAIHLAAEIRNHTAAAIKGAQATLNVDGNSRPVLLPELPPAASTNVPLTLTLDTPGSHDVSLALAKDPLPGDDMRYLSIDVRPTVSVLLIDGAPSAQKFESETDFLALAYSVGARPWNVERVSQIDPRKLVPGAADAPDVLVLANVASLSAEQVAAIQRLVEHGMGLMIFSGDLVDVDVYNERLYRDGRGLLPAKLDRPAETPTTGLVVEKDPQSPLAPLAKLVPEALARIHAKQYTTVRLGSTPPEGVSVLGPLEQRGESAGRAPESCRQGPRAVLHLHGREEVERLADRQDLFACHALRGIGDRSEPRPRRLAFGRRADSAGARRRPGRARPEDRSTRQAAAGASRDQQAVGEFNAVAIHGRRCTPAFIR